MTTEHTTDEQTRDRTRTAPPPPNAFWERFRDLGSLRRASEGRVNAGVAEGLSRHFDIDPIIVRVLFVVLTFFGGAGIILYLALWLTVPMDNASHSIVSGRVNRDPQAWTTVGLALGGVLAGAALLGSISWAIPHPFPFFVIALLLALALVAFTRRRDDRRSWSGTGTGTGTAPGTTWPVAPAPPVDQQAYEPVTQPLPGTPTAAPSAGTTPSASPTHAWWQRDDNPPTGVIHPPLVQDPPPPRPKRPRSHLFGLTMATVSLVLGGLWIFDVTSSYDPDPSVYPGAALGVIAAGLLLGAWWGRSRGLIVMGVLAVLVTAGAAVAGPGPYGDVVARPTQASQLKPAYKLGGGQLTLHLEQISDIANLNGRTVDVNARFGHVVVIVPSSVAAILDVTVDHGEIDGVRGEQDLDQGGQTVLLSPAANGRPAITLNVHLRFGEVQIERAACPGAALPAFGESTQLWNGGGNVPAACN